MLIQYTNKLAIKNIAALPKCKGAKYLLCIKGLGSDLIAKSWHRKLPESSSSGECIVQF